MRQTNAFITALLLAGSIGCTKGGPSSSSPGVGQVSDREGFEFAFRGAPTGRRWTLSRDGCAFVIELRKLPRPKVTAVAFLDAEIRSTSTQHECRQATKALAEYFGVQDRAAPGASSHKLTVARLGDGPSPEGTHWNIYRVFLPHPKSPEVILRIARGKPLAQLLPKAGSDLGAAWEAWAGLPSTTSTTSGE